MSTFVALESVCTRAVAEAQEKVVGPRGRQCTRLRLDQWRTLAAVAHAFLSEGTAAVSTPLSGAEADAYLRCADLLMRCRDSVEYSLSLACCDDDVDGTLTKRFLSDVNVYAEQVAQQRRVFSEQYAHNRDGAALHWRWREDLLAYLGEVQQAIARLQLALPHAPLVDAVLALLQRMEVYPLKRDGVAPPPLQQ
jgi:hypothetical protein